jgi:ElaB/YqjD/DUF883 family membrane-anchored ribosome-binding protein
MPKVEESTEVQVPVTEQASAMVQEAAASAQETVSELRDKGSAQLRDQLDSRTTEVGGQAKSVAGALRRSGESLEEENGGAARIVTGAADRVERLGGYLEQRRGDEIMRDVESFARSRPWLIAGVGVLVGIAAARFLKASSEQRHGDNRPGSRSGYEGSWSPQGEGAGSGTYAAIGAGSRADKPREPDADAPLSRERIDSAR